MEMAKEPVREFGIDLVCPPSDWLETEEEWDNAGAEEERESRSIGDEERPQLSDSD